MLGLRNTGAAPSHPLVHLNMIPERRKYVKLKVSHLSFHFLCARAQLRLLSHAVAGSASRIAAGAADLQPGPIATIRLLYAKSGREPRAGARKPFAHLLLRAEKSQIDPKLAVLGSRQINNCCSIMWEVGGQCGSSALIVPRIRLMTAGFQGTPVRIWVNWDSQHRRQARRRHQH